LFIVIACDGIWDVMSNEEVVQFVYSKLSDWKTMRAAQGKNGIMAVITRNIQEIAAKVCDELLLECLRRGSEDNMSLLLVLLPAMVEGVCDEPDDSNQLVASTPRGATSGCDCGSPTFDTPECMASPSPLYLPGTLEDEEGDDGCSPGGGDGAEQATHQSAPSPIRATKLF
jgi:hypothetical protein